MSIKDFIQKMFSTKKDVRNDPEEYIVTKAVNPDEIDEETKAKDLEKLTALEKNISQVEIKLDNTNKSDTISRTYSTIKNPFTGE